MTTVTLVAVVQDIPQNLRWLAATKAMMAPSATMAMACQIAVRFSGMLVFSAKTAVEKKRSAITVESSAPKLTLRTHSLTYAIGVRRSDPSARHT